MISKESVVELLNQLRFQFEEMEDPDSRFNLAVPFQTGRHGSAHLICQQSQPYFLAIVKGIRLGDEHWATVVAADANDLARFSARVKQLLLLTNLKYGLIFEEANGLRRPRALQVTALVEESTLTRGTLEEGLTRVLNASLLFVACAEEQFQILRDQEEQPLGRN